MREYNAKIPDEVPPEWAPYKHLLTTSRAQMYSAFYLTETAENLVTMRKNAKDEAYKVKYCDLSYEGTIMLRIVRLIVTRISSRR